MSIDLLEICTSAKTGRSCGVAVELGVGGGGEEGARQPSQRGLLGVCGVRGGAGGSFQEISRVS